MSRWTGRWAASVLATLVLVVAGQAWAPTATAAQGELTKIGGQGSDGPNGYCDPDPTVWSERHNEDERKKKEDPNYKPYRPTHIGNDVRFSSSTGMTGLAADLRGNLYLATGGLVLGEGGLVAGGGEKAGDAANGRPPSELKLARVGDLAIDPLDGRSLWILETPQFNPGRIWRVDPRDPGSPVSMFAVTTADPTAIAADGRGNVYYAQNDGAIVRVGNGSSTTVGTVPGAVAIAVDAMSTQVFVATPAMVYRLSDRGQEALVGGSIAHADGGDPTLAFTSSLAIGHQIDDTGVRARYLYVGMFGPGFAAPRVLRVELQTDPPTIARVAGGGTEFRSSGPATNALIQPSRLAADALNLYVADGNQCAIFSVETPPAFKVNTVVTNPAVTGTTVKPADPTSTGNPQDGGGTEVAGNTAGQNAPVTGNAPNPSPQPNETGIISNTPAPNQTQIIDQGNSAGSFDPVVQATPQQAVSPNPTPDSGAITAANPSPTPTPTPSPTPSPTPDASATVGRAAETAVVDPIAPPSPQPVLPPAPDPGPIAGSVAPPPAAQPVSNLGVAGSDGEAARGATRYAMVRSDDDDGAVAAVSMVLGGVLLAGFLCVMFVAPGASSKPKPRPKGAY